MPELHTFFPLGLICSHHNRWLRLEDAIVHADLHHPDCLSCSAEALLCESLLEDARTALEIFVDNRR